MIDISLMAPAVQTPPGAATPAGTNLSKEAAPATQGFLRLFEIVLDGMPRPATDPLGQGMAALAAGPVAAAPAPEGLEATQDLSALLATQESLLPDQASRQIADLLQGLGFDVDASEIMALAPLDRLQLDQAMEFLQRGLEAGMPTSELLENASFLMPREWDFQGPQATSTPRGEGLAVATPEAEGVDPAQILAATEAVRALLAAAMAPAPSSPKLAEAASGISATSAVVAAPVAASSPAAPAPTASPVAAAVGKEAPEGADPRATGAAATESVTTEPRSARPTVLHGAPSAARPERPGAKPTQEAASEAPSVQAVRAAPKAAGETPAASVPGTEAPLSQTDSAPTPALPARAGVPQVESRLPSAEGVKPGSMASEFIGRQVLEKVDVHLRQGKRELTVRIWPEELGEVRLSLRMGEADKLDARILVQTEGVRQALLDATPQLREALARHGMEMGRLSVGVENGRSEPQMAGGERRDGDGRGGDRGTPRRGWREQEMQYAGDLALGVDSGLRDGRNTLDMWS